MVFCNHCGNPIASENAQFCPRCGAPRPASANPQGYSTPGPYPVGRYPGQPGYPAPPAPPFGMKWLHFLIYFSLFAGAAIGFVYGILYLTGGIYNTFGSAPRDVYATFPGLQAVDVGAGVLYAVLAGFSIYTRFRLSGFRANGPVCLTILYAGGIVLSLIYTLAAHAVIGWNGEVASDVIASVMPTFAVLCLNLSYFKKRQSLFCN